MIIPVNTSNESYDIVLERGALFKAGEYLNLNRKALIVTDDGVPSVYAETISNQCKDAIVVTLPQGEKTKSFDSFKFLLSKMVENNFTRSDCVIAVGGGVIGDLSGFVASSYMRGVDFYNIPTTLLSQVDSSIGGKVAINFDGYKNIIGAFYQPKKVIIDFDVLSTLPKRQISNGLAESLKMSLTSDAKLFELIETKDVKENIEKIIEASLLIKKSVVEQDEKETGLRKILNFGHTVAHGIESDSNLSQWFHGECVAVGMLPMCSREVRNRVIPVLEKLNLPTKIPFDTQNVINAMSHDKKMSGDSITVVTVEKIGQCKMENIPFEKLSLKMKEVL
ncbi:MAG: 3-dehydroquinate synthase [Ruminococcaceae bacterium]|nr:3-dehydroquinate synthase [Oscillospiraceae bacterium]